MVLFRPDRALRRGPLCFQGCALRYLVIGPMGRRSQMEGGNYELSIASSTAILEANAAMTTEASTTPIVSIMTSDTRPPLPGTKVWWYSSEAA